MKTPREKIEPLYRERASKDSFVSQVLIEVLDIIEAHTNEQATEIERLTKQRDELTGLLKKHYVKYQISFRAPNYYYCPVCRVRSSTVDVKCKPNCPIKLALDAVEEDNGEEKD